MAQQLEQRYPSRVPPDFVKRTVSALLPPVNVKALSTEQLLAYRNKVTELVELVKNDPVRFFKPSAGGQWDFLTANDPHIQGLYFFAGNKTGKTTGAAILISENCAGQPFWGRSERQLHQLLLGGRQPIRACAFCEDFSTHEETILPTILTWTPRKFLAPNPVLYGPSGNPICLNYANGSKLFLRTYDQGYAKAEGKDYDLVWCDEPPTREMYTAIFRGLVTTRGRLVIAATLLSEAWLYDEIRQPFVRVFEADIYQNSWLDDDARRNLEATLTDEERDLRIYGRSSALTGKIYPGFADMYPFVLPYIRRPYDPINDEPYPIIMGVDPHERKGIYCEWGWLTPINAVLWFDWAIIKPDTLTRQFEAIAAIEAKHEAPTHLVIMDPNRGKAKQIDNRSWQEEFEDRGFEVLLGMDDLRFGIASLREMLSGTTPRMAWLETCRGKGGPIDQMTRYQWEDWSRSIRHERSLKEQPKKVNGDFPDIHRYVACARLEYSQLAGSGPQPLSLNGHTGSTNPYC